MSEDLLGEIALFSSEEEVAPGETFALESRLCLVQSGSAEVLGPGDSESPNRGLASEGDILGDLSALSSVPTAAKHLRPLTSLRLLVVDTKALAELIAKHPESGARFAAAFDEIATVTFLRTVAGPFRSLDVESCRRLSAALRRLHVPAGASIFEQGEAGDCCYLVLDGAVEVVASMPEEPERRVASLGPGAVFGEVALLTEEPRNATVRATKDSDLLVLGRDPLAGFLNRDRQLRRTFTDMLEWRSRPRKVAGVIEQGVTTPAGEFAIILKRPARHSFYRLSELGWFIWQRIDGQRQLRDLTLESMDAFKTFAPAAIQGLLRGLGGAGFIEGLDVRLPASASTRGGAGRILASLPRRISQWELSLRNVDSAFAAAYRGIFWRFFTRPALVGSSLLILVGFAVFVLSTNDAADAVNDVGHFVLLLLIPGQFLAVLVHEGAHAFAVKRYGREIPRVGLGWYWFGPVAFVDTSDMWLAAAGPRIATSLAGPFGDLLMGALFGLLAGLSLNPLITAAAWQLAFSCFIVCLLNFNPLLEYDGYYALSDFLDRPNLRQEALTWLGRMLRSPSRSRLAGHRVDALFAIASCAFIFVMASITILVYRLFLEGVMAGFLPSGAASVLAFALATVVALSAGLRLFGEVFAGESGADQ